MTKSSNFVTSFVLNADHLLVSLFPVCRWNTYGACATGNFDADGTDRSRCRTSVNLVLRSMFHDRCTGAYLAVPYRTRCTRCPSTGSECARPCMWASQTTQDFQEIMVSPTMGTDHGMDRRCFAGETRAAASFGTHTGCDGASIEFCSRSPVIEHKEEDKPVVSSLALTT